MDFNIVDLPPSDLIDYQELAELLKTLPPGKAVSLPKPGNMASFRGNFYRIMRLHGVEVSTRIAGDQILVFRRVR